MKIAIRIAVAISILFMCGCIRPDEANRVLRQAGYTNIEITGYRPFMGSQDDTCSTGFRAKAPNGETVTGAVTSGVMKGATIRDET